MEHPFVGNISHLSMEELTEKINTLNKSMSFSARTGRYDMANQIKLALNNYRAELSRKQRELLDGEDSITGSIDIT